ncbi:hypothetical protein Tco_1476538 [Tanacetum coccineum]
MPDSGLSSMSGETVANVVYDLSSLLVITMILNGIQPVLSGVVVGCAWQAYVAYVNIGCYYVVCIPLGFLLGLYFYFGVKGIWLGMIRGIGMQTLILHWSMFRTGWKEEMHADKNIELNYGQKEADPSDHVTWYGYIKNYKKTVKNRQTRTRERKSVRKPEAKDKAVVNLQSTMVNKSQLTRRQIPKYSI